MNTVLPIQVVDIGNSMHICPQKPGIPPSCASHSDMFFQWCRPGAAHNASDLCQWWCGIVVESRSTCPFCPRNTKSTQNRRHSVAGRAGPEFENYIIGSLRLTPGYAGKDHGTCLEQRTGVDSSEQKLWTRMNFLRCFGPLGSWMGEGRLGLSHFCLAKNARS